VGLCEAVTECLTVRGNWSTELPPPWRTPNVRRREVPLGRMSLCQCVIQMSSASGNRAGPNR
jgi:hypothetical protein